MNQTYKLTLTVIEDKKCFECIMMGIKFNVKSLPTGCHWQLTFAEEKDRLLYELLDEFDLHNKIGTLIIIRPGCTTKLINMIRFTKLNNTAFSVHRRLV